MIVLNIKRYLGKKICTCDTFSTIKRLMNAACLCPPPSHATNRRDRPGGGAACTTFVPGLLQVSVVAISNSSCGYILMIFFEWPFKLQLWAADGKVTCRWKNIFVGFKRYTIYFCKFSTKFQIICPRPWQLDYIFRTKVLSLFIKSNLKIIKP